MKKTGFGLIGYGAWGRHHARVIAECSKAELVAIAVRSAANQDEARRTHPNARVIGDYRELLGLPEIEVVDVVLPSDLHFAVSTDVLQADKHLLLEKPMALSIDHCEQLIELAKRKNRLLAIGHELRLSSLWGKVKEMIDTGSIGDPLYHSLNCGATLIAREAKGGVMTSIEWAIGFSRNRFISLPGAVVFLWRWCAAEHLRTGECSSSRSS